MTQLLDSVMNSKGSVEMDGLEQYLNSSQAELFKSIVTAVVIVNMHKCEILILATGFESQVPGMQIKGRFPPSRDWYVSKENPAVHYIGWLMHQRDFRKGAGGFLSGYRYLIRNLAHHIREEDHNVPYPYLTLTGKEVLHHAINRFQISDDLVILQDGVVLRDMIVPVRISGEEDSDEEEIPVGDRLYHYYEGVTYKFQKEIDLQREDIIFLYFAWGDGRNAATVFDNAYMFNDTHQIRNIYLHPVVETNGLIRETEEDLEMIWNTNQYVYPIRRIIRDALKKNLTQFYTRVDYPYMESTFAQNDRVMQFEKGKPDPIHFMAFTEPATSAILSDGSKQDMKELNAAAKRTMPWLEQSMFEEMKERKQLPLENLDLSKMRVRQLRTILYQRGVKCTGCVEKEDFIKKIQETEHLASG